MLGKIHSIETFATLEGAGIRFAIFLQGCPLRCVYCHNPDTWSTNNSLLMTAEELVAKTERYRAYYINGGGVTITGGEPLMQSEFLLELLKLYRMKGYHTAIDTSGGVIPENIDDIIDCVDMAIVDLKFCNHEDYYKYTKGNFSNVLELLDKLKAKGKQILVRTVIVPNLNDSEEALTKYVEIIKKYNVRKYELMAYHTMGEYKYKELGIEYPLDGVEALSVDRCKALQSYANELLKG